MPPPWTLWFSTLSLMLLFTLFPTSLRAAEIDSFSDRDQTRPDTAERINVLINRRLEEGVRKANLLEQANAFDQVPNAICNEETLYTELRKAIFQSLTASWGLKGYSLDQQMREALTDYSLHREVEDSIYRDFGYLDAPSMRLKGLSDMVWVNGHFIGLDKLGHFFAEGWSYFEMTQAPEHSLNDAIRWGHEQEEGKFGLVTTGVFSYADLAANFNGWRFWNQIRRAHNDPLRGFWGNLFAGAQISCSFQVMASIKQRQWVYAWELKQDFDIRDYVDGAWDEGQNCSRYANTALADSVQRQLSALQRGLQCPLKPGQCQEVGARYGPWRSDLLHPRCLDTHSD